MSSSFEITKHPPGLWKSFKEDIGLKRFSYRIWKSFESEKLAGLKGSESVEDATMLPDVSKHRELPFEQNSGGNKVLAVLTATIAAAFVFLLVPLIQWVDLGFSEKNRVEEISFSAPTPKVLPQAGHREAASSENPPLLVLDRVVPKLELQMMNLELQPSLNGLTDLNTDSRILDELVRETQSFNRILKFEDLPSAPRILHLPEIQFPSVLVRQKILKGRVVVALLIDEDGNAYCEGISYSSHPILEALARNIVSKTRFSISKMDGVPVKVRGDWPLNLQAP